LIVDRGEVYLDEGHKEILEGEPEYVKERYRAVARTLSPAPFGMPRETAAEMIRRSLRQLYRIIKRFKEEGIPGLRFKSKRPRTSPRRTPPELERKILATRSASGFGPRHISSIVNEGNRRKGKNERISASSAYNILVRNGVIAREMQELKEWRRFEWGHPNRLIQSDLTEFNGVQVLTMEDDHSRRGWALALSSKDDDAVATGMERLIQVKYDNLLTDNGSQFSRQNSRMRRYCDAHVREKHIWTSIHHPQTMGKLSAFQKGLKRFLVHRIPRSTNLAEIQRWTDVYVHWHNNGRLHQGIKGYPEMRYSGHRDEGWFVRLVKALKLEDALAVTATE